ncbi:hypothetical protein P175DRAFT_0502973 [Aspergillus ochraceoroseus IBT 24754]|uniref:Uncharacterized protein n=1 Tax=Aspergillus ochraceoroseus IBT 24754 TaxID=1392256 RepID=A0A2T5LT20_9EURO|nr:uncharacterized protein P175DRAFT_0502973 [Aspergillus ochraceoroseus IBT 24754]PTU19432.1 hypothetical protein P175DRAFT_0502973 [Aspergillus ochraceoroseus IBT 24754]
METSEFFPLTAMSDIHTDPVRQASAQRKKNFHHEPHYDREQGDKSTIYQSVTGVLYLVMSREAEV